jgi:hypothetical protein
VHGYGLSEISMKLKLNKAYPTIGEITPIQYHNASQFLEGRPDAAREQESERNAERRPILILPLRAALFV